MNAGEIALVVVGAVALAESTWGISAPESLRTTVRGVTEDVPDRNPVLAIFFGGLAGLLWALMSPERTVADYALLMLSWVLAGGALVNLTPGGFKRLISLLILDRSTGAIRLFYCGELVIACVLIAIGVGGE